MNIWLIVGFRVVIVGDELNFLLEFLDDLFVYNVCIVLLILMWLLFIVFI